jgi:hypothetical protein
LPVAVYIIFMKTVVVYIIDLTKVTALYYLKITSLLRDQNLI